MSIKTAAGAATHASAATPGRTGNPGAFIKLLIIIRNNLFGLVVTAILVAGWNHRDSNYLSAETGAGYVLGIVGASLMLVLLLYPLSKRVTVMTRLVPIRYWFGFHMLLGVVGPVMVLFHSNFHLGSTNSSIAMICMLLVAGSGLVGRYIYTHIHHGLYGTKLSLAELRTRTSEDHEALGSVAAIDASLQAGLNQLEASALKTRSGIVTGLWRVMGLGISSRRMQKQLIRSIRASKAADMNKSARTVEQYMHTLRQMAAFSVYERLFSLWHILHLPLFVMMIFTAIIHVFAVHMY